MKRWDTSESTSIDRASAMSLLTLLRGAALIGAVIWSIYLYDGWRAYNEMASYSMFKGIQEKAKNELSLQTAIVAVLYIFGLMGEIFFRSDKQYQNSNSSSNTQTYSLNNTQQSEQGSNESSDTRECPVCAETIKAAAKLCRYCQSSIDPIVNQGQSTDHLIVATHSFISETNNPVSSRVEITPPKSLAAICPKCNGAITSITDACNHCNPWLGAGSNLKPILVEGDSESNLKQNDNLASSVSHEFKTSVVVEEMRAEKRVNTTKSKSHNLQYVLGTLILLALVGYFFRGELTTSVTKLSSPSSPASESTRVSTTQLKRQLSDGTTYEGMWTYTGSDINNGFPNGTGKIIYKSGKTDEGKFTNGELRGRVKRTLSNGETLNGEYKKVGDTQDIYMFFSDKHMPSEKLFEFINLAVDERFDCESKTIGESERNTSCRYFQDVMKRLNDRNWCLGQFREDAKFYEWHWCTSDSLRLYDFINKRPTLPSPATQSQSQPRPSQSQANNQPNPPTQNSQLTIVWNHNDSKMKIDMVNNTINIFYIQPRQAMLDAGAKPNDLLVYGTIQSNQITGTAKIFAGRCGQFFYSVTGNIFNNGREILLNGQAPVVNLSNCQVTKYVPDPLSFNVIQTDTQLNSQTQPSQPQANPDVEIKYANGDFYLGKVRNGKSDGKGTLTYTSGDRYVGEFKDGLKDGQGTMTVANGNRYVGEYKNDMRNGQGTFTWKNGDHYVGDYKNNVRTGRGTFTWKDGDRYIGEFKDGERTGQGTYTWANGDRYVGEFKDNKMTGQGTLTTRNGTKQVGLFKDDKYVGP